MIPVFAIPAVGQIIILQGNGTICGVHHFDQVIVVVEIDRVIGAIGRHDLADDQLGQCDGIQIGQIPFLRVGVAGGGKGTDTVCIKGFSVLGCAEGQFADRFFVIGQIYRFADLGQTEGTVIFQRHHQIPAGRDLHCGQRQGIGNMQIIGQSIAAQTDGGITRII